MLYPLVIVDDMVRPFFTNFFFNNNVLLKFIASVAFEDVVALLFVFVPFGKKVSELDSLSEVPFESPILGVNL